MGVAVLGEKSMSLAFSNRTFESKTKYNITAS